MNSRWIVAAWMVAAALCSRAQTIVVQNDNDALDQWKEKNSQYAHLIDPVLQSLWHQGEEVNEIILKKDARIVMRDLDDQVENISKLVDGMEDQINQQIPDNHDLSPEVRDQKKEELRSLKNQEKILSDSLKKIQTQLSQKKYQRALGNRDKWMGDILDQVEKIDFVAPLHEVDVMKGRQTVERYQQSKQQLAILQHWNQETVDSIDNKMKDYSNYLYLAEAMQQAQNTLATKFNKDSIQPCIGSINKYSDTRHGAECRDVVKALLGYEMATQQLKDIIIYVRDNSWRDSYSVNLLTDIEGKKVSPWKSFLQMKDHYQPTKEDNRYYKLLNETYQRLEDDLQGRGDYKESMNFKEYMNKILNRL